jgi:L-ascorbate metabolism protein UlaG (beta-lactamase superfamily)
LIGRRFPKLVSTLVLAAAAFAIVGCSQQLHRLSMKITYVDNCGFLVECGESKILIDALLAAGESPWYYLPSDSIVSLMSAAEPPFDNVDVIAVTHAHFDHFDPDVTCRHMKQDTGTILVCPPQAEEQMQSNQFYPEIRDRIHAVAAPADSVVTMDIAGIRVSALAGHHSPYYETDSLTGETVDRHRNTQHLEFLFTAGGRTIIHTGDAPLNDFERYKKLGLGRDSIDLAFIHMWRGGEQMSFEQKLVHDVIRPERIILMHLIPGREPSGHPEQQDGIAREVIVPRQLMQTWSFD